MKEFLDNLDPKTPRNIKKCLISPDDFLDSYISTLPDADSST